MICSDIPQGMMQTTRTPRRRGVTHRRRKKRFGMFNRIIENDLIRRVSYDEYRDKVQDVYGGPKGAVLATCSLLSLHAPLGHRIFRGRKFDLRGMRSILDVGSGAGQIARHVIKYADPQSQVTCLDLSHVMLRRARARMNRLARVPGEERKATQKRYNGHSYETDSLPTFVAGDLTQLPFADESFDGITCGYVLEHVPDPKAGLAEMVRVLQPGGRVFLLTTEDNFSGAWTSRMWYCRTYNRGELMRTCRSLGLIWGKELWFTPMHRVLRAGGICVELIKN